MISPGFDAAWAATWPAAEYATVGGFRVGRGAGGGGRVSAARAEGDWHPDDIDRAIAQQCDWAEAPLFAVSDDDAPLATALTARGWHGHTATVVLQSPIAALTDLAIPPVSAFALWPPLAIQRDLWTAMQVGPPRQAVMDRACGPKTAILGRTQDRAAGTAFLSVSGQIATLHALAVLPRFRRAGLADWMIRGSAAFGARHGAETLALAVTASNAPALALYDRLGFAQIGRYDYWQRG